MKISRKIFKPLFLLFCFIFPMILMNLIIIIPYSGYSHNREIAFHGSLNILPHDIWTYESLYDIELNFKEHEIIYNQFYVENISYGFCFKTNVGINGIDSDIYLASLPNDFLFNQTIWNKKENLESIISLSLAYNLSIVPKLNQEECLNIIGNNISVVFNSTLIMQEESIFGEYLMKLLRKNLGIYSINFNADLPVLVIPQSTYKYLNLTSNLFEKQENVLYFIYYSFKEALFEEYAPISVLGEMKKLRYQIKQYLDNIFDIELIDTYVYNNFYSYFELNMNYSYVSDLIIPTLIFAHGFAIGIIVLYLFLQPLLKKLYVFLRLLLERGGTKIQATNSIVKIFLVTNVLIYVITLLISHIILNVLISRLYETKINFLHVFYITTISSIVVLTITLRKTLKYILDFKIENSNEGSGEESSYKRRNLFILTISITTIEFLIIYFISLGLIKDFEMYAFSNPWFLIGLFLLFFILWLFFLSNILYKVYRKIVNTILSQRRIGKLLTKLIDKIPIKEIRTFRVFILLFFILFLTLQMNDTIIHRQEMERDFNSITDVAVRFDCVYSPIFAENFKSLTLENSVFYEMRADFTMLNKKDGVLYYHSFSTFIFTSANFTKYLSYTKIDPNSINFNESSDDFQFFISDKFNELTSKSENDFFDFYLGSQPERFLINGIVNNMPILSLIAHKEGAREIRDAYTIIVYPNDELNNLENHIINTIVLSILKNNTTEQFKSKVEYFKTLGIIFEVLESTTFQTDIMINQPEIQLSSFFYRDIFPIYGLVELILLFLSCFYLLGFSIYSFYTSTVKSSFTFISRGLRSKQSLNFSFFVSLFLILFYIIVSMTLSTAVIGLLCIFLSTKFYVKYYPFISISSLAILFSAILVILFILLILQIIFKNKIKKDFLNILKDMKYVTRFGD